MIAWAANFIGAQMAGLALPMSLPWVCLDTALLAAVAGFINVGVPGLASAGIAPPSMALAGVVAKHSAGALFLGAGALLLLTALAMRRA